MIDQYYSLNLYVLQIRNDPTNYTKRQIESTEKVFFLPTFSLL